MQRLNCSDQVKDELQPIFVWPGRLWTAAAAAAAAAAGPAGALHEPGVLVIPGSRGRLLSRALLALVKFRLYTRCNSMARIRCYGLHHPSRRPNSSRGKGMDRPRQAMDRYVANTEQAAWLATLVSRFQVDGRSHSVTPQLFALSRMQAYGGTGTAQGYGTAGAGYQTGEC